jgi:hypothetical protein
MPTRPNPEKSLFLQMADTTRGLLTSLCDGVLDVPLGGLYPYLNFNELLAFAGSAYHMRYDSKNDSFRQFQALVGEDDWYNLFDACSISTEQAGIYHFKPTDSRSFGDAIRIATRPEVLDDRQKEKFLKLNPFSDDSLKERLDEVPEAVKNVLRSNTFRPAQHFVFECAYKGAAREANTTGIRTAAYPQPFKCYPTLRGQSSVEKRNHLLDQYATSLGQTFKRFDKTYIDEPAFERNSEDTSTPKVPVQLDLF